jgi:hypothetical protein
MIEGAMTRRLTEEVQRARERRGVIATWLGSIAASVPIRAPINPG